MEVSPIVRHRFYTENQKAYYNRILLILKRTTSFLSSSDIIELKVLNSFFHDHTSSPEFELQLIYNYFSILSATEVNENNFTEIYKRLTGLSSNYIEIFQSFKFFRNLIKNPVGEAGFNNWKVQNSGDGWGVEDFFTYRQFKTVFASSYNWCILKTSINIEGLSFNADKIYHLAVGSPVARRWDCPSEAKLVVKIFSSDGLIDSKEILCTPEDGGTHTECLWGWIGLFIKIQPEANRVKLEFHGKDSRFWAGRYGARFGYCYAFIVPGRAE